MNNKTFVNKALDIANNYKTAYVWGAFGLVANAANMQRMINQYSKNNNYLARARRIYGNGFFFDCVGLIKGILWGWCGNASATYGGAKYTSNGVPDVSADQMIALCKNVSTDFTNIEIGEAVWLKGHIGIYVGNGKVVEATPAWTGGVQISDISKSGKRSKNGSGTAYWKKHGKLPYVTYETGTESVQVNTSTETATNGVGIVKTGGSNLNLRSTYSTAGDVLAQIPNGTKLAIVATVSNGWFKVRYGGSIGYVSGDYLVLSAEKLTDITGHYAESHIRKLLDYGVVSGYEDKSYRPDNAITRAEFASLTSNALEKACGYSLKSAPVFADMEGHWAKEIVAKLVACGIVNGFEDRTFKPDLKITRGQAAIIAANMLSYCGLPGKDYAKAFPDTAGHYADGHIQTLQHYGVVNGYEDGLFRPDEEITRGQAAMYIANCLTVLGK